MAYRRYRHWTQSDYPTKREAANARIRVALPANVAQQVIESLDFIEDEQIKGYRANGFNHVHYPDMEQYAPPSRSVYDNPAMEQRFERTLAHVGLAEHIEPAMLFVRDVLALMAQEGHDIGSDCAKEENRWMREAREEAGFSPAQIAELESTDYMRR